MNKYFIYLIPVAFFLIFFLAFMSFQNKDLKHEGVFNPEVFTLDNDLKLIVVKKDNAQAVVHMIWYNAGSADDPKGKSGLAHILEHMMFRGTQSIKDGEFSRRVKSLGGEDNAFTSYDFTAYFQKVPSEALAQVMSLEADRMQNLIINEERFETERNVVMEERRARVEQHPETQLFEAALSQLFPDHPYGVPVIGHEHELKTLRAEDLMAYYRNHYKPENAVVVVVGQVDPKHVLALAKEHYGSLPASESLTPPLRREAEITALIPAETRRIEKTDPRAGVDKLTHYYLVPTYRAHSTDSALALDLLSEILGNPQTGVLYQKLVVDQKIAADLNVHYDPMRRGALGVFSITLTPLIPLDEVEAKLNEILKDIQFSKRSLNTAYNRLYGDVVFAQDSLMLPAYVLGEAASVGVPLDFIENWPSNLRNIDIEDIRETFEAYLKTPAVITALRAREGEE